MNALEKSAWTEFIVVLAAVVLVAAFVPWMGHGATGWFGLLGLLPLGMLFLRKRGDQIVVDERDREIQRFATQAGVHAAWMGTFLAVIAVSLWFGHKELDVPTRYLNWIVWLQFAGCYGVKGLATIYAYRGQRRAA